MKRFVSMAASALLMFAACGKLPEPDAHELAQNIISAQGMSEAFAEADSDMVSLLFDIEIEDYSDFAVYYSSEPACADIVVVFKSEQSEILGKTKDMLGDFRASRLNDFKGYAPEEAAKIERSDVISKGKYVILAVMPDSNAAVDCIDSAFKK